MAADPRTSIATYDVEARAWGSQDDRTLEVHGCLVIGGPDLECRTYPGGPTVVRGVHTLVDEDGEAVQLTRSLVAICRCGRSQLRPLCDGTHRFVPGFDGPG